MQDWEKRVIESTEEGSHFLERGVQQDRKAHQNPDNVRKIPLFRADLWHESNGPLAGRLAFQER
jgi:hypothetical protein